jgi:hypothetical protein
MFYALIHLGCRGTWRFYRQNAFLLTGLVLIAIFFAVTAPILKKHKDRREAEAEMHRAYASQKNPHWWGRCTTLKCMETAECDTDNDCREYARNLIDLRILEELRRQNAKIN